MLAALGKLPSLSALSIAFCQAVTDSGVEAFAPKAPKLRDLNIDDCTRLGDASLLALAAHCRGLESLSARRCVKMTDAGLVAVAERGALRRLAVSGSPGAGAAAASALARCCGATLEWVDASFCRAVPEAALGLLLDHCPRLRELRAYGCTQVTDRLVHGHSNDGAAIKGLATSVRAPA